MAWEKIPGIVGKVYRPEVRAGGKKHLCPDCCSCQQCSEERCRVCLGGRRVPKHPEGACFCSPGKEVGL